MTVDRRIGRREFVQTAGLGTLALGAGSLTGCGGLLRRERPQNVVFILADDLGYGEVGCFGQDKIRTPNIDRLATEGMRLTQHYSGSPVCAPSRCTLLTGLHTGHAYIRNNDEMNERGDVWHDPALEGQRPLLPGTFTIGTLFQSAGYATAAIGKWGLGGPDSTGHPNRQGFDLFYGHLCQRVAHNYYPTHLWRNGEQDLLGNAYFYPHARLPESADSTDPASYEPYRGEVYAMDRMAEEARRFIHEHHDRPFFLYLPFPVPHAALQVPEDSLAEYAGAFPETPYVGDQGYTPQRTPRAAYAAMVTRMDREIGAILDLLESYGLTDDTLVVFTSDNGPTFNGGTDSTFFESAAGLRGLKQDLYEGGIRVPTVVRWPGRVPAGSVSGYAGAFWDWLPTFADLLGIELTVETDGVSLLPVLQAREEHQAAREYLYWEFGRGQAVRIGDWKAVRRRVDRPIELYDLASDPVESRDAAAEHPEVVERIAWIMENGRTPSERFPLPGIDRAG
jgi:arylsulfatase A